MPLQPGMAGMGLVPSPTRRNPPSWGLELPPPPLPHGHGLSSRETL